MEGGRGWREGERDTRSGLGKQTCCFCFQVLSLDSTQAMYELSLTNQITVLPC